MSRWRKIKQIYKEIYSALDNCDLVLFMAASHMDRGLGERKIKEVINKYPNIIEYIDTEMQPYYMIEVRIKDVEVMRQTLHHCIILFRKAVI